MDDGNLASESVKNAFKNHSGDSDDFKKAFVLLVMEATLIPRTKPGVRSNLFHLVRDVSAMEN